MTGQINPSESKQKQTMKIVLNKCFGGFQLSNEAFADCLEKELLKGVNSDA